MNTKRTTHFAGFTLLETLIALFILGIVLVFFHQTLSATISRTGDDRFQLRAVHLARETISRIQAGHIPCNNFSSVFPAPDDDIKWETVVHSKKQPIADDEPQASSRLCRMTLKIFSASDSTHFLTTHFFVYLPPQKK